MTQSVATWKILAKVAMTIISISFIVTVYLTVFEHIVLGGPPTLLATFEVLLLIGTTIAAIAGVMYLLWEKEFKKL
jgi:hypothetical protein